MHHDEANQAVKFGALLERGEYRYDANDHHGPTLYYLTLPAAWLRGQSTLASLDERTLVEGRACLDVNCIAPGKSLPTADGDIDVSRFELNCVRATTHPLRLRRLGVDDVDGLAELVVKASGLWAFLRRMRGDRRLHLVARRSRIDT